MTMTAPQYFGGSTTPAPVDGSTYPIGSPYLMNQWAWNYKRVWQFEFTAALGDSHVQLPDARDIPLGAEIYFLITTVVSSDDIVILDADGVRCGSLPGGAVRKAVVCLLENDTAAGNWAILVGSAGNWIITT